VLLLLLDMDEQLVHVTTLIILIHGTTITTKQLFLRKVERGHIHPLYQAIDTNDKGL
jgi:hypothetical protein